MDTLAMQIQNAAQRTGGLTEMNSKNNDAQNLYHLATSIDSAKALNFIRNAQSEEERDFFAYVADMNLRRNQRRAIEKDLF